MGTILDNIVETKRRELQQAKQTRPLAQVKRDADTVSPPRDFKNAIVGDNAAPIRLIAEIKKASPSAGLLVEDFDPASIAKIYHQHGAAAISVLTDTTYFDGCLAYIEQVKSTVPLPVLRKDFILDDYQLYEARAAEADAVLLICEVLAPLAIRQLALLAAQLGMTALVEVHDASHLSDLLKTLGETDRANIVLGINNRDLKIQRTDLSTTVRLAGLIPETLPFISESGITTRSDVQAVQQAGASAILVGESILRSPDMGRQIDELMGQ